MKKVLVIMLSLGLALGASAQRFHGGGGGRVFYGGPRVIVGVGAYAPFYSPFYSPFYPYGYSPYGYGYNRPSKLDLKIQDIKNDYKDRIWSVKHDDSLSKKEKRQKVHDLKVERDRDINDTKSNYYKNY